MDGLNVECMPYLEGGRELCQTGCAILWRGDCLLSETIELFSQFSHCSLVVRMDEYLGTTDRVTTIEALASGLRLTLLSKQAQDYDGEVYLFIPEGLTPTTQERFRAWAVEHCAEEEPYNMSGLFTNAIHRTEENAKQVFCSEAYGQCLEASGVQRKPEFNNGLAPRPGDVPVWWKGRLVKLLQPFAQEEAA